MEEKLYILRKKKLKRRRDQFRCMPSEAIR